MRIIAGLLRGRDLGSVPRGVRPTADRVRESLFATLGPLDGLRVLDLFAGTGALGLEALSRGAMRCTFVERSRRVAAALERRLGTLGLAQPDPARLLVAPASRALGRLVREGERFDLVLVDPPYADAEREERIRALFHSGLLAPRAMVVVEGPKRHPVSPLAGVRRVDERPYGDTLLTWLTPAAGAIAKEE